MMKDAPIIILDEATANVDPENEKELMEAICELTHEKTVIMIAHRLKTVRHADQILVVNKGADRPARHTRRIDETERCLPPFHQRQRTDDRLEAEVFCPLSMMFQFFVDRIAFRPNANDIAILSGTSANMRFVRRAN